MSVSGTEFTAKVVTGAGRGRAIGTPTMNLDLTAVPADLREGVYAVTVFLEDAWWPAAMHYGPRPVFQDGPSCEVHVIDREIPRAPATLTVRMVRYLRAIRHFESPQILAAQIALDIDRVRYFVPQPLFP